MKGLAADVDKFAVTYNLTMPPPKGNDGIFYIVEFRCGVYNIISKIAPSPSILSTIKPMTL